MNNSKIWIAVIVVAIIAVVGVYSPQGTVVERTVERVGAIPGTDFLNTMTFFEGFTTRGHVATSSDTTSFTLSTRELDTDVSYIEWEATAGNATLTTMASTSAPFSNLAVGEGFSVDFYSSTTTTATTITFAAGTGVDLQEDEGGTVVVNGLETARLNFRKKTDTDVLMWVEVGQVGD